MTLAAIPPLAARSDAAVIPQLYSSGVALDRAHIGYLTDSSALLGNVPALHARMAADGYLYMPGLLNRDAVLNARRDITTRLQKEGILLPGTDPMEAIIDPAKKNLFRPDLTKNNPAIHDVLYAGALIEFFEAFLGGAVRHFDFTWLRTVSPGHGTRSHVDSVYMNRGTTNLFTTWIPLGDTPFDLGGLMVLERTNNNLRLKETYGAQDIDSYCTNKPDGRAWAKTWGTGGQLNGNPNQIRRAVGEWDGTPARWVTTEFQAGDALIFSIYTVHASLDNTTADRMRLSTDSRYQLASEPVDDRWVGENPPAHGPEGKRGKIC